MIRVPSSSSSSSAAAPNGDAMTPQAANTSVPESSDAQSTATDWPPRRFNRSIVPDGASIYPDEDHQAIRETIFGSRLSTIDSSLLPHGKCSLTYIAVQAFGLGIVLATSLIVGPYLAVHGHDIWRIFAFLTCLSIFHFLEFWTTATYNTAVADASSFLLFSNGWHYNVAHALATIELTLSALFFPRYQHWCSNKWTVGLGLVLVVLGQIIRSVAMIQAGTNFNHLPARTRKAGHELVTFGIYSKLRHPSYFGFFWWAIGTQLLVGNKICTLSYIIVLWYFFEHRIRLEERLLVEFFGDDYVQYRRRTGTGIPFVR